MEIESSLGSRIFWGILGLGLSASFVVGGILATMQSGPRPGVIVAILVSLFPIGLGIATYLWLGRPAWIRVATNELAYVPPLGPARVFSRSSIKWIVRVPGGRGTSKIQFRDQDGRNLVVVEQGFAQADMEKLAQDLGAKFTWDLDWKKGFPAGASADPASRQQALQQMKEMMTPEERGELEKHLR
jgi:hypothetical protein